MDAAGCLLNAALGSTGEAVRSGSYHGDFGIFVPLIAILIVMHPVSYAPKGITSRPHSRPCNAHSIPLRD